ncbi:MAG: hypothetical protein ABIS21_05320 [Acidimicrobiales bacterium]
MPGRNPSAALQAFIKPLQQNVSCLSPSNVLIVSPGGRNTTNQIHSLTIAGSGPIRLRDCPLFLAVGLRYDIIKTADPSKGPFKVRTRAYDYALRDEDGKTLASYHWHPLGQSTYTAPHLHHPPMFPRIHWPCQRTSLEEMVRLCIVEFGATPARDDWEEVLLVNESTFRLYRSWVQVPELAEEAK